jgi:hypothetical protein
VRHARLGDGFSRCVFFGLFSLLSFVGRLILAGESAEYNYTMYYTRWRMTVAELNSGLGFNVKQVGLPPFCSLVFL